MAGKTFYVGKCECGGNVRGVKDFGLRFTWCVKCTPIRRIKMDRSGVPKCLVKK